MSNLPDRFTLIVERKPDSKHVWWKVTSPECPGLLLVHHELSAILEDVPRSIDLLRRLNAADAPQ